MVGLKNNAAHSVKTWGIHRTAGFGQKYFGSYDVLFTSATTAQAIPAPKKAMLDPCRIALTHFSRY